jgi:hypothetical protein
MRTHDSTAQAFRPLLLALAGLALTLTSATWGGSVAVAQTPPQNACGLLTSEELQVLVPKEHVPSGVANAITALEISSCRYTWGAGAGRMTLDITVSPVSGAYAGMNADAVKRALTSSIVPDTDDAAVADVGQAAVYRVYSAVYVGTSAYVKDHVLQINLDGIDATERKGQVVTLLKAVAGRL